MTRDSPGKNFDKLISVRQAFCITRQREKVAAGFTLRLHRLKACATKDFL